MAKSNPQVQACEPKNSAPRETTNPNNATSCSPEAPATVPRVLVTQKGSEVKYRPICEDPVQGIKLLMGAIGAEDMDFLQGSLSRLAEAGSQNGSVNQANFDFLLSIIKGIKPKNQIEAMLVIQMAGVYFALMKLLPQLTSRATVHHLDNLGGLYNKLARTFATQFEVLHRSRLGSEQKVTIQNVSVSESVVGNITQKATDAGKAKAATTPAAVTKAAPMAIIEPIRQPDAALTERKPRQ